MAAFLFAWRFGRLKQWRQGAGQKLYISYGNHRHKALARWCDPLTPFRLLAILSIFCSTGRVFGAVTLGGFDTFQVRAFHQQTANYTLLRYACSFASPSFPNFKVQRLPHASSQNTMSNTIQYSPGKGIAYNGVFIPWGADRASVRHTLQSAFEVGDREFSGTLYPRDIFDSIRREPAYFFINYDPNNRFSDLEIHEGVELEVGPLLLSCGQKFDEAVRGLQKLSTQQRTNGEGEELFVDLRLSLSSGVAMGAEDEDALAYIYCAADVGHLLG